jgi:ribonuclease HII
MPHNTIKKIETLIQESKKIDPKRKAELLSNIALLKEEIKQISQDSANSIANFAETATHEALREQPQKVLIENSTLGLEKSAQEFASSNPDLYNLVRTIVRTLSNLGV